MKTTTLTDILNQYRTKLSGYYPDEEIRQLFLLSSEHLLNYSKIDTFLKTGESISAETEENFANILKRLLQWEPIQYITGTADFYGLKFYVDRHVLIPRQETEELVQWIIKSEQRQSADILDIGTGSGCIAVSLACSMPDASVWACDISAESLEVAATNAESNNADIRFFPCDVLDNQACLPRTFGVIVSNPPYVRESEKVQMLQNVTVYEPPLALYVSDSEPLVFYKRIALLSRKYLKDGGSLYFEINEHFPDEVVKLLKVTGFYAIEVKKDINGKARMVKARK